MIVLSVALFVILEQNQSLARSKLNNWPISNRCILPAHLKYVFALLSRNWRERLDRAGMAIWVRFIYKKI